ncbi:HPr family phosphocarrier protein [bacterium]|nr:HPr family phosphocarrier protein [candidate division CSSED10-310 bacterium]
MVRAEAVVRNPTGLHMRPAMVIVKTAGRYRSHIEVCFDDAVVNAKSLMGLLTLGAGKGTRLTVAADGADEREALAAMLDAISWMEEDEQEMEQTDG